MAWPCLCLTGCGVAWCRAAGEGEEPKAEEAVEEEPSSETPLDGQVTPTKEEGKDKVGLWRDLPPASMSRVF